MATNNPRRGYERKRSQLKTKTMGQKHWTKRSRETGEFMVPCRDTAGDSASVDEIPPSLLVQADKDETASFNSWKRLS
jgi:hypothetical protein